MKLHLPCLLRGYARTFVTFSVLPCLFAAGSAYSLPSAIEADRLILAAEQYLEEQDYVAARAYLERMGPLEIEPPARYHLLYARVLYQSDAVADAKQHYERYVEKAGSKAPEYEAVLKRITAIEERLADAQKAAKTQRVQVTQGGRAAQTMGSGYDSTMTRLYLGSKPQQALVAEVNSVLTAYPYLEGAVKNLNKGNQTHYFVALNKSGEIVVTRRDMHHQSNAPSTRVEQERWAPFGVNPEVQYRCSKAQDSCVVLNPVDGSDWLKIARDERGAQQLSNALSRLIRSLQRK